MIDLMGPGQGIAASLLRMVEATWSNPPVVAEVSANATSLALLKTSRLASVFPFVCATVNFVIFGVYPLKKKEYQHNQNYITPEMYD